MSPKSQMNIQNIAKKALQKYDSKPGTPVKSLDKLDSKFKISLPGALIS